MMTNATKQPPRKPMPSLKAKKKRKKSFDDHAKSCSLTTCSLKPGAENEEEVKWTECPLVSCVGNCQVCSQNKNEKGGCLNSKGWAAGWREKGTLPMGLAFGGLIRTSGERFKVLGDEEEGGWAVPMGYLSRSSFPVQGELLKGIWHGESMRGEEECLMTRSVRALF